MAGLKRKKDGSASSIESRYVQTVIPMYFPKIHRDLYLLSIAFPDLKYFSKVVQLH